MNNNSTQFSDKCLNHKEYNIEYVRIKKQNQSQTSIEKPYFYCQECINSDSQFDLNDYQNINYMINKNIKKIIRKWPPIEDQEIINKLIHIANRNSNQEYLVNEVNQFFKDLKESINNKIDIIHNKMLDISKQIPQQNEQILNKYYETTRLNEFNELLTNQNTSLEEKQKQCKEFIDELHSSLNKDMLIPLISNNSNNIIFNQTDAQEIQNNIEKLLNDINLFQNIDYKYDINCSLNKTVFNDGDNVIDIIFSNNNRKGGQQQQQQQQQYQSQTVVIKIIQNNNNSNNSNQQLMNQSCQNHSGLSLFGGVQPQPQQGNIYGTYQQPYQASLFSNQNNNNNINNYTISNNSKNIISNIILDHKTKYLFHMKINQLLTPAFIGIMKDKNTQSQNGYNDNLSFCLIQNSSTNTIQPHPSYNNDKFSGINDFQLYQQNEFELRICIYEQILEIIDLPQKKYKISLNDYSNLNQTDNFRFYIGINQQGDSITLLNSSVVSSFN